MPYFKEKYINPFTDFGFKKLFGTEPNKDLLIDFLNEVVLPKNRRITDVSYKPSEQIGDYELDRKAIFDIYCIGEDGEYFIVEMQKAKQNYFKDRSVFYSTFPIQEQAKKGGWNYKLSEVYTVGVLDFVFDEEPNAEKTVRHEVKLKDQNCHVFYDKLTFVYLEMPHFVKKEEELETLFDKWLYVLKHLPELEKRPKKLQEKVFSKLFEVAEIAKFTPIEQDEYQGSLKTYWDLKNVLDTAKDEGIIEGREEGLKVGLELGREQLAIEMALQMLQDHQPIEQIMRYTKLNIEQIEALKENKR